MLAQLSTSIAKPSTTGCSITAFAFDFAGAEIRGKKQVPDTLMWGNSGCQKRCVFAQRINRPDSYAHACALGQYQRVQG
eukprot:3709760-Rhodomonas_salina.2